MKTQNRSVVCEGLKLHEKSWSAFLRCEQLDRKGKHGGRVWKRWFSRFRSLDRKLQRVINRLYS